MMLISVVHMKGGTGKTTTAAHLLAALAARGADVAGIDADTQGSLVGWAQLAGDRFPTVEVAGTPQRVDELAARYRSVHEHVVLDTPNDPSRSQAVVQAVLGVSDQVVVPVAPSPLEFLRLSPTATAIEVTRQRRPSLRSAVLLSRVRSVTRSAGEARDALTEAGWDVLSAEIPLREAITQSVGADHPHDAFSVVLDELLATARTPSRS